MVKATKIDYTAGGSRKLSVHEESRIMTVLSDFLTIFTSRRSIRYILYSAVVVAIIAMVILFGVDRSRPFTVAFLDFPDKDVASYASLLPETVAIVRLDSSTIMGNENPEPDADCFIGPFGLALSQLADATTLSDVRLQNSFPPSVLRLVAGIGAGKVGLPLQIDHFSLSWDREAFDGRGQPYPLTRDALEAAMSSYANPVGPALLFAGGDDETLLLVLSVLCVSESGAAGYDRAVEVLRQGGDAEDALSGPLGVLTSWNRNGYLHPEWYKLTSRDVRAYVEKGFGYLLLATLGFRRTVDYQSIYRFGTAPFPSAGRSDAIVAPLTAAVFSPRRSMLGDSRAVIDRMVDPEEAFRMAVETGKASTLSTARAPDVQAADALSWVAGRQTLVNGLYRDAFASAKDAGAFAA
ncbi:MAG: hypothetical protein JXM71_07020, partial [Spirochaetales bacterium]|nr:hypothetical protein [Spirochaetales bacterium]